MPISSPAVATPAQTVLRPLRNAARQGHPVISKFLQDRGPHLAAMVAYYALLSLVPFMFLALSVLGFFGQISAGSYLIRELGHYLPGQSTTDLLRPVRQVQANAGTLGVIGLFGILWASLGFFSAINSAVNSAWRVERQRSYLKHKLVAFLMLAASCGLLALTLVVFSASQVVGASWFTTVAGRFPWLMELRSFGVSWAATFALILAVGLVFYFVPNAKVRFRDVWVGAVLTGLLWRSAFEGFSWYVRDLSRFSVHGSIGAVVIFLLWVYVSAVILLYGVEFTAAYSRIRRGRADEAPAAPPLEP